MYGPFSLDLSKFPPERDIYTARELAHFIIGMPMERLKSIRAHVNGVMRDCVQEGFAVPILDRKLIRWDGNVFRLYSIRNHEKYKNRSSVREHLNQFRRPL